MTIDQFRLETFAPLLGTRFRVYLEGSNSLELELVEATLLQGGPKTVPPEAGVPQEAFSLLFDGPEVCLLPQRMYAFEHERLGRFDLFIVPIGRKSGSIQYQAVFNRLGG